MEMPVCRAIATTKMHYLKVIQDWLRQAPGVTQSLAGYRFGEAYPDLSPASGGTLPMTEVSWRDLKAVKVWDGADYVKHVLTKHDGEAKFVGDEQWREFDPDSVGAGGIRRSCFWEYQFCRQLATRDWLWKRSMEEEPAKSLSWREVDWVMRVEDNALTMLRCEPLAGGHPSSRGTKWFIRIGKYVTLAEMFYMGRKPCTCFDLYRSYCNLHTAIFRRKHSESRTPSGTKRANAKRLQHAETGRWGLEGRR